jgi:hypothetical protein
MAITQAITNSFRQELLQGVHIFGTHTFKIALYLESATLNTLTTAYTASGEVSGTGYVAGGETLTVALPTILNNVALVDFLDVTWAAADFSARAALIYNATQANRSVAVLDFGMLRPTVNGSFIVTFPIPDAENAIIRLA